MKIPKNQVLVGATEVTRDTVRDTALMGSQHEVHLTAASAFVKTDEEQRIAENSYKEVSTAPPQGAPDAAEITTMVHYTGATNIETEGGRDALSAFYAALPRYIRKKHLYRGSQKLIKEQDLYSMTREQTRQSLAREHFL